MFAPIYAAAFDRGIPPNVLDDTAPYLVAWALTGAQHADEDDTPEGPSDLIAAYLDRQTAVEQDRLGAWYEPDRVAVR